MNVFSFLFQRLGVRRTIGGLMLPAFLLLRIWDPTPLETIRLQTFDFYQALKPRVSKTRPVVIVDIDEDSLREIGQWPWPRVVVADLVAQLQKAGVLVTGFDVLFPEPDRMSPRIAADSFRALDAETRDRLRALPGSDEILAQAIRQSRVVLGQSGVIARTTLDPNRPQTGFAVRGPDPSRFLVTFPGLLTNLPVLEDAAAGRGLFSIRPERDGIVRRVPVIARAQDAMVPSLTLEMLRVVTGSSSILVRANAAGLENVAVPQIDIPTDRNGQVWIHFGPHDRTRYVSAKDVLRGNVPDGRLAGKLALIGTSAVGLLDIKTTPVESTMPGVEVHAQLLESALTPLLDKTKSSALL
ncbi:MAG: CHASE2 domain-containing protein, partial [Pseudorhodoplanes sp.]